MGSGGKKKTTMAKLARENRLRERRQNKAAKREARRHAPPGDPDTEEGPAEGGEAEPDSLDSRPGAVEPTAEANAAEAREEQSDPRASEVALLRLRDAPDEQLAVFEARLRADAQEAGATEQEIRDAQREHPGHGL
jgi:hypothetical protein